jgi:ABC-type nitrate/sulfonate/bicarbonate transport system ATPase subunit
MQEELISILDKTGTTALLVTHDIDEALYLADRIGVMSSHPGRVISTHNVNFARPRDRSDEGLLHLRVRLLEELLKVRS